MTNIEEPLNTQENIDIVVQENTETKGKIILQCTYLRS